MTFVGRPLNRALLVALLVLVVGTVGATVLAQSAVSEIDAQNEQLRAQNQQLREDIQSARERIESLESEVNRLERKLSDTEETLTEVRAERNEHREDLQSVCDQWQEEHGDSPAECDDV